jgi:aminocarboxymuconate-semialdehyde decarboxylase
LLAQESSSHNLASRVSVDRIVLGSDDSFPPADLDPLASLRAAGFDVAEVHTITEHNPRSLFRL